MVNYTAKLLNNARSSLAAQQAVIANVGNNIANVNTPGFSRRSVHLETNYNRENGIGVNIGNGVRVASIQRETDSFLDKLVRDALGSQNSSQVQNDFLSRIENLFNLTDQRQTIGSTLSDFYTAVNDLSADPSSIELRTNLMQRAQDLVSTIRGTYNTLAGLQTEADQRIGTELQTVNSLTSQIANLNKSIRAREAAGGAEASDERDARETLLNDLSEKIGFQRVDLADGTTTLYLPSGFALVVGENARQLSTSTNPSFSGGSNPPSLSGATLSSIVYNYGSDSSPAHIDLTQMLRDGGGSIGGLLTIRGVSSPGQTNAFQADGTLVAVASRVEALTRSLLTSFNQTYQGTDIDTATAGFQSSARGLPTGTPPTAQPPDTFGLFDFNYGGTKDGNGNGRPDIADLDTIVNGSSTKNFSSVLQLAFTDPRRLAAAVIDAPGGTPAPGDGRNLLSMAATRSTAQTLGVGNFTLNATYDESYNEAVTHIGNLKSNNAVALSVASDNLVSAQSRRDEVSGVSLDEEFTSLIQYQKAYQASARMIKVADDLLTQILQLL